MTILQMSKKGYILIPKRIRRKLGIEPGSKVLLVEGDNNLLIKPAPDDPIDAACGFINYKSSLAKELLEEHKEEKKREQKNRS